MAFKQRGKSAACGLLTPVQAVCTHTARRLYFAQPSACTYATKLFVHTLPDCLCAHYKATCTDAASGLQPHNEQHYAGKWPIRLVANLNRGTTIICKTWAKTYQSTHRFPSAPFLQWLRNTATFSLTFP